MYYFMMVVTFNDGTAQSKAVYSYESKDEAVSNFHKQMGGWMLKDNVSAVMCIIVDDYGNKIRSESYQQAVTTTSTEE